MEIMTNEEIIVELKTRIEELRPHIEENDSNSEYFAGVQEGYCIVVGMLSGEFPDTTPLPDN
jgi:hypothetical protein